MSTHGTLAAATVVRRRDVTDDLFVLWIEPHVEFTFRPGQYVTIGAGGIERPYSIVSAPGERWLELFIEYVPPEHGGHLTPLLHALRVGDAVTMRPRAKGKFTLRPGVSNHVMVSTVTGIAPFVSILRQFALDRREGAGNGDGRRFFVMQGASHQDEFGYDSELRMLGERHPEHVEYVCSISRPSSARNIGWSGPTGRINLLIEEYLERWGPRRKDTVVYLCGHPGMIEDAVRRLAPKGWSVVSEHFWRP